MTKLESSAVSGVAIPREQALQQLVDKWRKEADRGDENARVAIAQGLRLTSAMSAGMATAIREKADDLAALFALTPSQPSLNQFFETLRAAMTDLPPDAAKVLHDNLWALYDGEAPSQPPPPAQEEIRKAFYKGWLAHCNTPHVHGPKLGVADAFDAAYPVDRVNGQG